MLVLHLVPDGVGAFHPCLDVVFQSHLVECLTYRGCKVGEEFIARCLCVGQFFLYGAVFFGVFKLEAQVFQFGLDLVQSQSVGQGSIDVECFAGNFVLLVGGLAVERAHVVQSVAYLDEDDTYVVAHGEQQFLEVLCLCRCLFAEDSTADFCQSVNDLRYFCAEDVFDVFGSIVGVFHHIVQQGCTDAGRT